MLDIFLHPSYRFYGGVRHNVREPFNVMPAQNPNAVYIRGTCGIVSPNVHNTHPLLANITGLPEDKHERERIIAATLDLLQMRCNQP